jgi:hypothetical protein
MRRMQGAAGKGKKIEKNTMYVRTLFGLESF